MEDRPYAEFMKLSEEKQTAMIQEQKQTEEKEIPDLSEEFPDRDFI